MLNSTFGKQDDRYRENNEDCDERHYFLIARHFGNLSNGKSGWMYYVDGKPVGTTAKSVYENIKNASPKMLKGRFYPAMREVQNATRELAEWSHAPIKLVCGQTGWYTDKV